MKKEFLGRDFLLETDTAKHLFHEYAENLPIIDYHCHIPPKEIFENRRFQSLDEVWLGGKNPDGTCFGDHYKWRLMRANGIPEEYITGEKPGAERIEKFAQTLELAIGNPMYHWTNLELKRFFDAEVPLTAENAKDVYEYCSKKLRTEPDLCVRGLIEKSNVEFVGTTDDPADDLQWHQKIAADPQISAKVCPSFRPDKAIIITRGGFREYIEKLGKACGRELHTAKDVKDALVERLEFFVSLGCRASDHGLDFIPYCRYTESLVETAFQKAMSGKELSSEEAESYETYLLLNLAREYARLGVVMQLHYSTYRNSNERLYREMGPDTGGDIIAQTACGSKAANLLSALDLTGECPKTVLYSLNPADNQLLDVLAGTFQDETVPGKIQHGAAWWFNDTKAGMEEQMKSLAALGLLGNFIGMLTDSRSFLSYPRHEYFRRIFCNLLGNWVENGEYPDRESSLKRIVEGVCYKNAKRYFCL